MNNSSSSSSSSRVASSSPGRHLYSRALLSSHPGRVDQHSAGQHIGQHVPLLRLLQVLAPVLPLKPHPKLQLKELSRLRLLLPVEPRLSRGRLLLQLPMSSSIISRSPSGREWSHQHSPQLVSVLELLQVALGRLHLALPHILNRTAH
jgi:hypothetical protein